MGCPVRGLPVPTRNTLVRRIGMLDPVAVAPARQDADAQGGGDPLDDAAGDRGIRDCRSHLVTLAKRATATVSKHLAVLQDSYVWWGLG
jgi:hypothetical protein